MSSISSSELICSIACAAGFLSWRIEKLSWRGGGLATWLSSRSVTESVVSTPSALEASLSGFDTGRDGCFVTVIEVAPWLMPLVCFFTMKSYDYLTSAEARSGSMASIEDLASEF